MSAFSFIDSEEYRSFLSENETADVVKLRLKEFRNLPFDKDLAITQIACRKKARLKIPELAERWVYPTDVSIEQCTSEILAKFHAGLFAGCDTVADLTCGLGIDSYYLSFAARCLWSVEANPTVAEAADLNFRQSGRNHVVVVNDTAEHFTEALNQEVSAMFVDPSRRLTSDRSMRTYSIKDTVPDLSKIIPAIRSKCGFLIVKASPMADIAQTIKDFPDISDVWVLSLKNECKELLFKIDFQCRQEAAPSIHTLNFDGSNTQHFSFRHGDKAMIPNVNPKPGQWLCLPNSSVMKSGAYGLVAGQFDMGQISANSHLLVSGNDIDDAFPGKSYRVTAVFTLSKSDIKELQKTVGSANISCRNFPLSPDELRKRLKINDGGNNHIFATTLSDGKRILILCTTETVSA